MATEADEIKSLNGKLGGQTNSFGRCVDQFDKAISQASTIKTEFTLEMMHAAWNRCAEKLASMEETITELDILDSEGDGPQRRATNYKTHSATMHAKIDKATKVEKAWALPTQPQPAAPAAPTAQSPGNPRSNDLLRPESLNTDDRPSTLRNWKRVFTAYYKQQRMNLMSAEEQQMYFSQCLSRKLWDRISGYIRSTTPVLPQAPNGNQAAAESCFSILDEEFKKLYPLVKRRRDVFEYRQSSNQKWTDMSVKLKELAIEGELSSLSFDELLAYLHIMATTDSQLRTKFFQMEEPTLEKMSAKANSYESAESGMRGLDTANAQAVQHPKAREGTRGFRKEFANGSRWLCWRCNSPNHDHKSCTYKTATCTHCKKTGHIVDACKKLRKSLEADSKAKDATTEESTADINAASTRHVRVASAEE